MLGSDFTSYRFIRRLSRRRTNVFLADVPNLGYCVVKQGRQDQIEREKEALEKVRGPGIQELLFASQNEIFLKYYPRSRDLLSFDSEEIATVFGVLPEIVRIVRFCHAQGYAHGDLKPSNILLGSDSSVTLIDFGAALPLHIKYDEIDFYECTKIPGMKSFKSAEPENDWITLKYYFKEALSLFKDPREQNKYDSLLETTFHD